MAFNNYEIHSYWRVIVARQRPFLFDILNIAVPLVAWSEQRTRGAPLMRPTQAVPAIGHSWIDRSLPRGRSQLPPQNPPQLNNRRRRFLHAVA